MRESKRLGICYEDFEPIKMPPTTGEGVYVVDRTVVSAHVPLVEVFQEAGHVQIVRREAPKTPFTDRADIVSFTGADSEHAYQQLLGHPAIVDAQRIARKNPFAPESKTFVTAVVRNVASSTGIAQL